MCELSSFLVYFMCIKIITVKLWRPGAQRPWRRCAICAMVNPALTGWVDVNCYRLQRTGINGGELLMVQSTLNKRMIEGETRPSIFLYSAIFPELLQVKLGLSKVHNLPLEFQCCSSQFQTHKYFRFWPPLPVASCCCNSLGTFSLSLPWLKTQGLEI